MKLPNDRGLSLAEILLAMSVMSIALVGLAGVIPAAAYAVQAGHQMSAATFLAEQRLEEIRDVTWTGEGDCLGLSAVAGAPTSTTCARQATPGLRPCATGTACVTYPDESVIDLFPGYRRTTRVTDCSSVAGCAGVVSGTLRIVRVTVSYRPLTAPGRGTSSVVLEWLASRR